MNVANTPAIPFVTIYMLNNPIAALSLPSIRSLFMHPVRSSGLTICTFLLSGPAGVFIFFKNRRNLRIRSIYIEHLNRYPVKKSITRLDKREEAVHPVKGGPNQPRRENRQRCTPYEIRSHSLLLFSSNPQS